MKYQIEYWRDFLANLGFIAESDPKPIHPGHRSGHFVLVRKPYIVRSTRFSNGDVYFSAIMRRGARSEEKRVVSRWHLDLNKSEDFIEDMEILFRALAAPEEYMPLLLHIEIAKPFLERWCSKG